MNHSSNIKFNPLRLDIFFLYLKQAVGRGLMTANDTN